MGEKALSHLAAPARRRLLPVDGALTPGFNPNLYGQHPVFESAVLDSRANSALFSTMTLQCVYSPNRGEAGAVPLVCVFAAPAPESVLCSSSIPACAYGQSLVNNCLGIIKCS